MSDLGSAAQRLRDGSTGVWDGALLADLLAAIQRVSPAKVDLLGLAAVIAFHEIRNAADALASAILHTEEGHDRS